MAGSFEAGFYRLADELAAGYETILGNRFVGFYVHGSLAFGCFHPAVSDLDFIAVVSEPPSQRQKERLLALLFEREPDAPAKGFEMSVVEEKFCRDFVYPTPYEFHYSPTHRARAKADPSAFAASMHGVDRDLAAHFTVLMKVGATIRGKALSEVFGEVPEEAYDDSLMNDLADARDGLCEDTVYFALNFCRVLAWRSEKKVLSKKSGGEWGLKNLPSVYHPVIRSALDAYAGADVTPDRASALRFRAYVFEALGL